ncbi:DUF1566 domain-containing protein [Leucothrix pacifica]|uniref:Lcl C-terminal domain-containing protein n=1 Tax=Leucothrix pacifica TaxID=1247513 RepID=A0A317C131_9GAMM|nr:DUF1566 domain-containing protein [Leucothrix pacifica]PWQ92354.1 hypothetical protein DKW60_21670 [Leucothrix pacifica]
MKTIISIALSLGLLSGVAQAQSCNTAIEDSTPDIRFVTSGDEVKDLMTNLTWKRCAQGQVWNSATSSCVGTVLSLSWSQALSQGTGDWRLPNIKELLSIVEISCSAPAINETIFPNTPDDYFWTSSPYINNAQAWLVLFEDGNDEGGSKSNGNSVRLVKDGDS